MNKGKRLIPEDLLQYVNDLNEYHPDPEAEWGGGPGGISIRGGTGIKVTGADIKTISVNNDVAMKTDIPTVPTKVSQLQNDTGYITGITSSDVTTALGYTPGTSNFSGNYNDLTNKPSLATVATTGDYDDLLNKPTITNVEANPSGVTPTATLTSLEVGNTVYSIPQGGSGDVDKITIDPETDTITDEQLQKCHIGTIIVKPSSYNINNTNIYIICREDSGAFYAQPINNYYYDESSLRYANYETISLLESSSTMEIDKSTKGWSIAISIFGNSLTKFDAKIFGIQRTVFGYELKTNLGGGYKTEYLIDSSTFTSVNYYYTTTDTYLNTYFTDLFANDFDNGERYISIVGRNLNGEDTLLCYPYFEIDYQTNTIIIKVYNGPTTIHSNDTYDEIVLDEATRTVITPLSGHFTQDFYTNMVDYPILVLNNRVDPIAEKLDKKFIPLVSDIPDAPTVDGSYHLECTVNNGQVTYTWVLNSI